MATGAERDDGVLMSLISDGRVDAFEELYDRYCGRLSAWLDRFAVTKAAPKKPCKRRSLQSGGDQILTAPRAHGCRLAPHRRAKSSNRRRPPRPGLHRSSRRCRRDRVASCSRGRTGANPGPRGDRMPARSARATPRRPTRRDRPSVLRRLTHVEIAARLGLPCGTVKGRMRLGLKKLKAHMAELAA